jgi:hypothetical protein
MFADPAVISINGVNKSLPRINGPEKGSSEYLLRSATNELRLNVRNFTKRFDKKLQVEIERHTAELVETVFSTATAPAYTRKVYVTFENQVGDTLVDPLYDIVGLLTFLTTSSGANVTKMMNSES